MQNLGTKIGAVSVFTNHLKDLRKGGEEPVRKSCQVGYCARSKFIIKEFAILKRESWKKPPSSTASRQPSTVSHTSSRAGRTSLPRKSSGQLFFPLLQSWGSIGPFKYVYQIVEVSSTLDRINYYRPDTLVVFKGNGAPWYTSRAFKIIWIFSS